MLDHTPLPPNKKAISCKWIFKLKFHSNDTIERYKARLVTKVFTQTEGLVYHETFIPVFKMSIIYTFLCIASTKGCHLHQVDINTTILHGKLDKEIYTKLHTGLNHYSKNLMCKLNKSIYGLK